MLDEIRRGCALLNCSRPEAISASGARSARRRRPLGAYANGFTAIDSLKPGGTVKSLEARHDLGPDEYAQFALGWVRDGARIVGGCCEVGPDHIAALRNALIANGHEPSGELQ